MGACSPEGWQVTIIPRVEGCYRLQSRLPEIATSPVILLLVRVLVCAASLDKLILTGNMSTQVSSSM